ncbi:EAL domain-containing protein [Streptomyces sp. HNM0574]|uniref:putative bifunctional diguanylate cyclase/phosphodiesterase n=1 Tax=Streptomyces sp. HNM0574 TaxID=2714954 RepID=UPI001F0F19EA|nr:EAL domain-containing protein [Streptomyces sp. HNM0574]
MLLAALCAAYAVGAALGWGSREVALFMGDFGLSAAGLLAACSCLWYARTHRGSPFAPAWMLFGISSLMAACGNAVWGWYELVLRRPLPDPSLADACFLLFAPPAVVGLLVLAKRPVTRAGWICLGLDAWLIAGSLVTLSWSLALAHTSFLSGGSVLRAALDLAYPLLDIVLISLVLALHYKRSAAHRSTVNTAVGALVLTVLCDALFSSPMLREHYSSGQFLDAGWFAGSLLLAYAPWVARREGGRRGGGRRRTAKGGAGRTGRAGTPSRPRQAERQAVLRPQPPGRPIAGSLAALTPYLAAAVCTLGILYNAMDGHEVDRVVLFTGCTVVLALVIRQGIMLLDNISLTQELAQKENHFRSLVQGSSDVIMIASSTGVLRYVSPAAAGVYGRDGDALVGAELAAFIHPEDLGRVLHELRRFLAASPETEHSTRIECRFRHGAGHWLNVESTVNRYQGGLIFNSRDVTERVRLQAQLQHNASHDALTDLPNRSLFTERVRQALGGRRGGDSEAAVLYIDLDGFKAVNDTVGHQAGDELLVQAARRLQDSIRAGDTAARLGGDEFAVIILGDSNPSTHAEVERELRIHEIADRLRIALSEPYRVEGTEVRVAASIGVAFAEPGISPTALMRNADLAMYRAKQGGKARVELYAPQMQAEVVKRTEMASRLRTALRDGEFALLHQPVVDLNSGKVTAVAAQPRWRSAQGILFTPAEFLRTEGVPAQDARDGGPFAPARTGDGDGQHEQAGRDGETGAGAQGDKAAEINRWVVEEAVEQAAARQRAGCCDVPVTVRIPARRLIDRSMTHSSLEALLARHELPAGSLILELSDSDPRIPLDELETRLSALRRLGVVIALDGFGSGYLAISALRRLPIDILRLDRGLVDGVLESPRQRKITAGLLRIADDLGMTSVAEGVDLPEQVEMLREMGCTHGQGAVFSGPLDEHRLRRALSLGAYPLPEPAGAVVPGPRTQAAGGPAHAPAAQPGAHGAVPAAAGGAGGSGPASGTNGPGAPAGVGRGGLPAGAHGPPPAGGAGPVAGPSGGHSGGGRSVVVAGSLPVRRQDAREALPPWVVAGDGPAPACSNAETPVPPT